MGSILFKYKIQHNYLVSVCVKCKVHSLLKSGHSDSLQQVLHQASCAAARHSAADSARPRQLSARLAAAHVAAADCSPAWSCGVVVITSALHAEGPQFEPGRDQYQIFSLMESSTSYHFSYFDRKFTLHKQG